MKQKISITVTYHISHKYATVFISIKRSEKSMKQFKVTL